MSLSQRLAAALARPRLPGPPDEADDSPFIFPVTIPAAVLVAVTDRPEPGLLLTRRHDGLRKHAGQTAFAGGRVDPDDADEAAAAIREAHEEIGLPPESVDVVGLLDPFVTYTAYRIVPVLAVVPPDLPLVPQAGEVAEWFEVPFAHVLDPANREERPWEHEGQSRRYYEIIWGDRRIWGATAAMIVNLSRRLGTAW